MNKLVKKIEDRMFGLLGRDLRSYCIQLTKNPFDKDSAIEHIYVYPSSYGDELEPKEMDAYSSLIVIDGEVMKDKLGLFGVGTKL